MQQIEKKQKKKTSVQSMYNQLHCHINMKMTDNAMTEY